MKPHVACRSRVLEKHLREFCRPADAAIRLKGVDTAVTDRIVNVEI